MCLSIIHIIQIWLIMFMLLGRVEWNICDPIPLCDGIVCHKIGPNEWISLGKDVQYFDLPSNASGGVLIKATGGSPGIFE